MRTLCAFLVLAVANGSAVVAAQELVDEAIPNWPAPATWTPPRSAGVRTMADITSPFPFIGITPCRVADTRGNGFTGSNGPPSLVANANRTFALAGQCGVPTYAAAVSLNLTALNVSGAGDLRVFPAGAAVPLVSTMNYNANTPNIANAAVVPLGTGGGVTVLPDAVAIDLVIDVNGYYAGAGSGTYNTFLGSNAGHSNVSGDSNTAIGNASLFLNSAGTENAALGIGSLRVTTASRNTGVGAYALTNMGAGSDNIGIGFFAGQNHFTGDHNIYIGNDGVDGESNTIRIGNASFQSGGTIITGISGLSTIGGAPVYVNAGGRMGTSTSSSRRFKQDIRDIAGLSEGLMRLRPVAFEYKPEFDPTGQTQYGLIAEEVADIYPDLVTFDRDGRPEGVLYNLIAPLLLNEVQKQRHTIEAQQAEIDELKARLTALESRSSAEARP
jgi:hypothetical protein